MAKSTRLKQGYYTHDPLVIQLVWRKHQQGMSIRQIYEWFKDKMPCRPIPSTTMILNVVSRRQHRTFTAKLDKEGNKVK